MLHLCYLLLCISAGTLKIPKHRLAYEDSFCKGEALKRTFEFSRQEECEVICASGARHVVVVIVVVAVAFQERSRKALGSILQRPWAVGSQG